MEKPPFLRSRHLGRQQTAVATAETFGQDASVRHRTMSEDQLKAFLARVSQDSDLQRRLSTMDNLDDVLQLASESGFQFSKSDWQQHINPGATAMSDKELETVAGGICYNSGASHWGDGGQCASQFTCANTGLCDC
jgi:predicted ribosomally synthesized peptide with nif11-like leader